MIPVKTILKEIVRAPLDILISSLNLLRSTIARSKGDFTVPNLQVLNSYELLPGDFVITEEQLSKLESGKQYSLEAGSEYVAGSVVGYSYPTGDTVVVAYFNMNEFQRPVLKKYNKKDLILLNSPARSLSLAYKMTSVLDRGGIDFVDQVMERIDPLDPLDPLDADADADDDDGGDDGGGGGITYH